MGAHDYFNALVARPDHWKSWTLRDDAQLAALRAETGRPPVVKYDAAMDAAKVVIPLSFVAPDGTTKTTNNLQNQVRLPLGTSDGHVYFFVWDVRWSETYVGLGRFNHKAFQFTSGSRDGNALWLEVQTSYAITTRCTGGAFIGSQQWRTYNKANTTADWGASTGDQVGPGTKVDPLGPMAAFCLRPNRWTRFFLRLEQRANDYDRVDAWAADELTDPAPVMAGLLVSVRPDGGAPNSVTEFWLEFNSSTDALLGRTWDLVSHVRNFAALIDPVDIASLLIRPLAGVPVPPEQPQPPSTPRPDSMKNPRKCIFRHDDRASATSYEVDAIDSADVVRRTMPTDLGAINEAGEVVVDINVMPLPVGLYRFVVRAMNAGISSDPSPASVVWERAPGPPGQPRAA